MEKKLNELSKKLNFPNVMEFKIFLFILVAFCFICYFVYDIHLNRVDSAHILIGSHAFEPATWEEMHQPITLTRDQLGKYLQAQRAIDWNLVNLSLMLFVTAIVYMSRFKLDYKIKKNE